MSGIIHRTVYYDERPNGVLNFWNWAHVKTGIGTMVEPFAPGLRHATGTASLDFDPEDQMSRIDRLERRDGRQSKMVLSSGSTIPLHGGVTATHTGR